MFAKFNQVLSTAPSQKTIAFIWLAVLALLTWLYFPGGLFFLNDDFIHVPLSEQAVFGQRHSIRVVNDFSLYLDSLLYGKNAVGFHTTNLLLHFLNIALVFITSRKIFALFGLPSSKLVAHAAAMFFALYPFHSESVFWVIGRTGALSTAWMLLTFLAQQSRNLLLQLAGAVLLLLGFLTYESVLVYPFFVAAIWLYKKMQQQSDAAHWWQQLLLAIATTLAYLLIRLFMLGGVTDHYESGNVTAGLLGTLAGNYLALVIRLLAPPFQSSWPLVFIFSAIAGCIFVTVATQWKTIQSNINGYLLLALVLFSSLLPYISLGIDTHGVESERYLYVPSVFLSLIAAQLIRLFSSIKLRWMAAICFALYASICLLFSSIAFRTASSFAAQIIAVTNQYVRPTHQSIWYVHMPGEHRGVVLLRLGLPEGIAWLVPAANGKSIHLHETNMDPLLQLPQHTPVELVSKERLQNLLPTVPKDSTQQSLVVAMINNRLVIAQ